MSTSGLYAHFASKKALHLATVDTAKAIFDADVVAPSEDIADPLEHVRAIADAFLAHVERRVFPGGCFFISVGAELDMQPGAVKGRLIAFQGEWGQRLVRFIADARERGLVRAEEDPTQLAFEPTSFLLLGNTAFVMHDDPGFLNHARVAIDVRLRQATGAGADPGGSA